MWEKQAKKTIFTLNIDGYAPEITALTFPLLNHYAKKIGADFHVIKDRRWPSYPPVYEKFQIYYLAQEMGNDWNLYIDADALVHPSMFDITNLIPKDTVLHNGSDYAGLRWKYDRYFRRDGRNIGSCNWFTMASDWCVELWHPLEDLTLEEAYSNIYITANENNSGVMDRTHLIDDYNCSRNIAKYGLHFTTFQQLQKDVVHAQGFLWHKYTIPNDQKVREMQTVLKAWGVQV